MKSPDGDRQLAVRASESLFSYNAGRSGYGKTNAALGRLLALAHAGHGCLYLDPHGDAIQDAKRYLGSVAGRVEELNLEADPARFQAGWNPISMAGLDAHHVEGKVTAVVDSFAAALNWGLTNNRALTLTTMTVQSLCELSLQLPDDRSPTLFQITTLLSDEEWRSAVLPALSPSLQDFWTNRFPRLATDAITPVTNLLDRMRSSPTVAALFGSSRSTYDVRRSMDRGRIVLWSTAGSGALVTLVNCFVTYDLFRAAMSRRDIAEAERRPFYAFIDELQRVSGTGSGSAGESVARALEEARKMGLRMQLMSQQPTRLAKATLEAIKTNRSHFLSHTVSSDSAVEIAKEWGGVISPEVLTRLPKFQFLAQVTLNGELTNPFLVRGIDVADMWADQYTEDLAGIETAIDANLNRRPVRDILDELDTLDERIREHFEGPMPTSTVEHHDLHLPPTRCSGAGTAIEPTVTPDSGHAVVVPFRQRRD